MTREQIEALTMADVAIAKARSIEARKTRSGLSTIDFTIQTVNTPQRLEQAKRYLIQVMQRDAK